MTSNPRVAGRALYIFDLDGTLVDTSGAHAAAFAAAFAPRGMTVSYDRIAGLTTEAAVDRLLAEAGQDAMPEERRALMDAKRAHAAEALASVRPLPGVEAFLDSLHDVPCALWTSGARATVERTLATTGLADRFVPIVTADDVARPKPDPEGLLKILAVTGVAAGDALVFEDADAGLAAARAAGIDAIRIGEGHADWPTLTAELE